MIKSIISVIFGVIVELVVFGIAMSKIYDSSIEVVIVCIFLASVGIRSQLGGVGIATMMTPSLASDIEKDKQGETIDRKPYENMMHQFLKGQSKFAILAIIYFLVLLSL